MEALTAVAVLLAALIALLTSLTHVLPFGSPNSSTSSTSVSTTTPGQSSSTATHQTSPTSAPRAAKVHPVYLDTVPETEGDTPTRGEVSIDHKTYMHGLQFRVGGGVGVYAMQEATYAIPKGAQTFAAVIGNDDNQQDPSVHLTYEVFVDDRRVAIAHATGFVHDPPIKVDVTGASSIKLVNEAASSNNVLANTIADWANPVFR